MRRGGLLILLIGLILIVGAVALFLVLQPTGTAGPGGAQAITALPQEPPEVEVVRARVDIPANTVISDSITLLEVISIPETEFNNDQNYSQVSDVEGKLTTRAIKANEIVAKSSLTDAGLSQQLPTAEPDRARDKAYPFVVNNLSGVADQIKPGDFVDVVATFSMQRRQVFPTGVELQEVGGQTLPETQREITDPLFSATKTIVQRAQVLRIIRPQVASDVTPEAGNEPAAPAQGGANLPQVDENGNQITPGSETEGEPSQLSQGIWTLILSLNDQEIELMEFSLASNARMVLVLRGAGDSTYEPTIGATFDLLVSEFGVPLPRPLPARIVSEQEAFTPEPTLTPAPTRVP